MDSLYTSMTEDSLADLAKAGCIVDVTISGYGEAAWFRIKISKGGAKHGSPGVEIIAEGEGADGAAALRGAVATAETFLHAVPPRQAPKLPNFDNSPAPAPRTVPIVGEIVGDTDPLHTRTRTGNKDLAKALDAAAERELEHQL